MGVSSGPPSLTTTRGSSNHLPSRVIRPPNGDEAAEPVVAQLPSGALRPAGGGGGGGSRAADGRRLPRAAGACTFGRLFSISRHAAGLPYVTHGQIFPTRARRGRRFSGSSRPPARRSATSTLFVVIHRGKGATTTSRPATPRATATAWMAIWHDSFSALQPDRSRDLCRFCLPERPNPSLCSATKRTDTVRPHLQA